MTDKDFAMQRLRQVIVCWHPGCMCKVTGRDSNRRHSCQEHWNRIDPAFFHFSPVLLFPVLLVFAVAFAEASK